jgi:hypothetical protein
MIWPQITQIREQKKSKLLLACRELKYRDRNLRDNVDPLHGCCTADQQAQRHHKNALNLRNLWPINSINLTSPPRP